MARWHYYESIPESYWDDDDYRQTRLNEMERNARQAAWIRQDITLPDTYTIHIDRPIFGRRGVLDVHLTWEVPDPN